MTHNSAFYRLHKLDIANFLTMLRDEGRRIG